MLYDKKSKRNWIASKHQLVISDWGSPLVVIDLNYLLNTNYPIKKVDKILNSLRNSKYICRLVLLKGYFHLRTDEVSSIVQNISTHRGTYRMNRFRIKVAPAEFNHLMDHILPGLQDISMTFLPMGKLKNNARKIFFACLQKLHEYDLHLNNEKFTYLQT